MQLCEVPVANRTYAVILVQGRLYLNGKEFFSTTDHDRGEIYLSDTSDLSDRPRIAAVAVAEAWRYLTRGMPTVPLSDEADGEDPDE